MEVVKQIKSLAECSTFKLGGPCENYFYCQTADELVDLVRSLNQPYLLIGDGSNILFSDHGYRGHLVQFSNQESPLILQNNCITVSGGASLDALAAFSVQHGFDGLVSCSGIPGTVGGAVAGNAGAWGKQVGDFLASVTLMDRDGAVYACAADELQFRYRHSRLKTTGEVVLAAVFSCPQAAASTLEERRAEILMIRSEKHPDLSTTPCIGSIFKNIEPTSATAKRKAAGWFLERAGVKDFREGGATVYDKHANIIIKQEGCTAQQVHDLCGRMQQAVYDQFGIRLKREVRFLGEFDHAIPHDPLAFF